ncbi:MAG: chemotaxis protein CheW [Polyangiaceae bacterium]
MSNAIAKTTSATDLGGKYLTFSFGQEEYGVRILVVQEIIGLLAVTPVPSTPKWVRGVINLRGKIIPVIDLRIKFAMSGCETNDRSCIIVVNAHGTEMGMIVDRVSEVVHLAGDSIEPAPGLGAHVRTDYLLGIGKSSGRVRLLLDIERVLAPGDLARLGGLRSAAED